MQRRQVGDGALHLFYKDFIAHFAEHGQYEELVKMMQHMRDDGVKLSPGTMIVIVVVVVVVSEDDAMMEMVMW